MLTGMQIRAAAAALRWSHEEIARRAKVGVQTVQRMAAVDGVPPGRATSVDAVQRAFERVGIRFQEPDDGLPGVRLVKPPKRVVPRKTKAKAKAPKRARKR